MCIRDRWLLACRRLWKCYTRSHCFLSCASSGSYPALSLLWLDAAKFPTLYVDKCSYTHNCVNDIHTYYFCLVCATYFDPYVCWHGFGNAQFVHGIVHGENFELLYEKEDWPSAIYPCFIARACHGENDSVCHRRHRWDDSKLYFHSIEKVRFDAQVWPKFVGHLLLLFHYLAILWCRFLQDLSARAPSTCHYIFNVFSIAFPLSLIHIWRCRRAI